MKKLMKVGVAGFMGTFSVTTKQEEPKSSPNKINKTKKDGISKQRGNELEKERQTFNK